jgi:GntR family transcriptional regulator, transcriptional repressor for pyruvate dehydrogenase complex
VSTANVFARIEREPRLSDQVADAILETILSQRLRAGDLLPPERELGKQFGVSRTVVREAIRALDAKGLLEVRTGSGARIAAVDSSTARQAMRQFVHAITPDFASVAEVRGVLEVAAVELAAQRATPADLERLESALDRMADSVDEVEAAALADLEFHRAIASATQNQLFLLLHDSIGEALVDVRRTSLARGHAERVRVRDAHRRILDAVAAHDPTAAQAAMREHLQHVAVT